MKKILVVEDELTYLKLLDEQLVEAGYQVLKAEDGEKALKIAKKEKPDLILLDIRLPIMDGLTMLDELRKDEYGKTAKVIILTNLEPNTQVLKQVLEDTPIQYCIKSDVTLINLLDKIKAVLLEK